MPLSPHLQNVYSKRLRLIKEEYDTLIEAVFAIDEYLLKYGNKGNFEYIKTYCQKKSEMIILDIERNDIYKELFGG